MDIKDNVNTFYERVLKSLDVELEDSYLMIADGDKQVNYMHAGLPMVLPTADHCGSLLDTDESGKIITVKHLFNPMDETIIKGDSASLSTLKKLVSVRLSNRLTVVGTLLLKVAEEPAHQSKTTMLVNQFLVRTNEAMNPGIKKIVDDNTIDKWHRLYESSLEVNNTKFFKVFVKKGGKIGTTKYNRVSTFKFPMYEELLKLERGGKINGVALRNKDVTIFKILFEYFIEGINDKGIITIGSNDKESPAFISLMQLYLEVMTKIQKVLTGIKGVDPEWEDAGYIDIQLDTNELTGLNRYARDLARLPSESSAIKAKLANDINLPAANAGLVNTGGMPQQPVTMPANTDTTADAIHAALYGGVTGVNVPVMQQPPMQYQQPVQYQQPGQMYPQQPGYPQQPMQPPMTGVNMPMQQQVSIGAYGDTGAFGSGVNQPPQHPMVNTNGMWNR